MRVTQIVVELFEPLTIKITICYTVVYCPLVQEENPAKGKTEASSFFKHQTDAQIMNDTLLITCPKCGHRINGRLWRCPQCGDTDTDHKGEKVGKTRRGFRGGIIDDLRGRKTKTL